MHKKSIGKTYNVITFFLLFFSKKFCIKERELKHVCQHLTRQPVATYQKGEQASQPMLTMARRCCTLCRQIVKLHKKKHPIFL